MKIMKVHLLDCTLRDGGYINDWNFGESTITGTIRELEQTGIEMIEVGFIKGESYDKNRTLFPDTESFKHVITNKKENVTYVGMVDMSNPVSADAIRENDGKTIDGVRVIFKKDKLEEGIEFCTMVAEKGYLSFANFVSTDAYTDKEFIEAIERVNEIHPTGVTIVDTFGVIKRKQLRRLLALADNNLDDGIMLCYHGHNNLQQALSNAETMVEMNLNRDIVIDACVFGMGRGAGNLNLELFAEYLNENNGTHYRIEPMLEIMDQYLGEFYKTRFWGYSLPLYLTASLGYHPNYGIYLAEKNTLPVKAFEELLKTIPEKDKYVFDKNVAEQCYRKYFSNYVDDSAAITELSEAFAGKNVLLVAPGKSIMTHREQVLAERASENTLVLSVNFYDEEFSPDFVFMSNMKRSKSIAGGTPAKLITTSNIADELSGDYLINFASYTGTDGEIYDNAGLMALRFLIRLGVKRVRIAGMDGYKNKFGDNFFTVGFEPNHLSVAENRNAMIKESLEKLKADIEMNFVTPTLY